MENNELQHWGIKGQRWGHRRYQHKDGSLTPAGRKRYADDDSDDRPAYQKQMDAVRREMAAEKAAQRGAKTAAKYDAKMAKLEYKQAKKEAEAQEKAEKRKEFTKKVAIGAGIAAAAGLTYYGLKKYREKNTAGEELAKKMLDNMKDHTVDDVAPKAEKARSSFKDIFNKAKTKLENNIETGPMKDHKSSKPDYDIEIQDAPKQSAPKTEKKRPPDIYDVDFEDVTSSKKAKGESVFDKIKKKLESNIETGSLKDDSNRFSEKTKKSDYDIEIQDAPKAGIKDTAKKLESSKTIYDVDYDDVTSKGKNAVSGYLNSAVSGLLPAAKSSTKVPRMSTNSKAIERISSIAKNARDKQHDLENRYSKTTNEYTKSRLKGEIADAQKVAQMWEGILKMRREKM
jgi:hypothetical protein